MTLTLNDISRWHTPSWVGWLAACLLLHAALRALVQRCALHELKASVDAMPPAWQGHHESHLGVHCAPVQSRYALDDSARQRFVHLCPWVSLHRLVLGSKVNYLRQAERPVCRARNDLHHQAPPHQKHSYRTDVAAAESPRDQMCPSVS